MKRLLILMTLVLLAQMSFAEGVPANCTFLNKTCVEGPGTHYVNGVPVYSSCWKYERHYRCGLPPEDTCKSYEKTCRLSGVQRCLISMAGLCVKSQDTYECPTKKCEGHSLYCGKDIFCLDGTCATQTPTQNQHFGQDAGELAATAKAAGDAAKQLNDKTTVTLFQGHPQSCSIDLAGFSDCCKDSGWGKDTGLAQCSDQEKKLGHDKEHYLTTYVGKYCANKVAGVCTSEHKVYCVYESKLARIVADYGFTQLGKSHGSPKSPHCGGFSLDEFQRLNFNLIDFVDPIYIYPNGSHDKAAGIAGDMHVNDPSASAMAKAIKQRIQKDQHDHTPSSDKKLFSQLASLTDSLMRQRRGSE